MHNRYNIMVQTLPAAREAFLCGTIFKIGVDAAAAIIIVMMNSGLITDDAVINPYCVLVNENIFFINAAACHMVSALKITNPIVTARSVYICPKVPISAFDALVLSAEPVYFFLLLSTAVSIMVKIP